MNKITYKNKLGFPPTICIELHKFCNLKCLCCRSNASYNKKICLTFEDIKGLLNELSEHGKWRISITGGEPLLWKELSRLIELLYNLQFPFSLTTNGNCNENIITSIPLYLWKNGTVHISIDGNSEIHNYLRGKDSFENALFFMEKIDNFVPKVAVNTVLFTNPEIWIKNLLDILMKRNIHHWSIISPVKNGRWHEIDEKLCTTLTYQEQFEFIENTAKDSSLSIPLYKWNFSEKENIFRDTVCIEFDGNIRLPGYYKENKEYPHRPLIKTISINKKNASTEIAISVLNYIKSEKYIL